MLAQEQAVIRRGPGIRKGVEAAFGLGGETEGTLVLTDRRLVYVHGNEKEVGLRVGAWSAKRLFFSDVESLDSMPLDSASVEIPISKITKVVGHQWRGDRAQARGEVDRSRRSRPDHRVRAADDRRFEAEEPQRLGEGDREAEGEAAQDQRLSRPRRAATPWRDGYWASSETCRRRGCSRSRRRWRSATRSTSTLTRWRLLARSSSPQASSERPRLGTRTPTTGRSRRSGDDDLSA